MNLISGLGMWHSDKPQIQYELAEVLAKTQHMPLGEGAYLYMTAFWATMHREWYHLYNL